METEPILAHATVQAYRVLCEFCSALLVESPSEELIDQLIGQRSLLLEEPFASVAPDASSALYGVLERVDAQGKDDFVTEVKRDYTYLFYMVGASRTSPFESVYRTDDRTMFGPTTLQVRESYHAWGVEVPQLGNKPDDHIGYEFAFLTHVLGCAADALAAEDDGAADEVGRDVRAVGETDAEKEAFRASDAVRSFLSDHLLVFAPTYFANMKTRAHEPFYRAVADISLSTLLSLAQALGAKPTDEIDEAAYRLAE